MLGSRKRTCPCNYVSASLICYTRDCIFSLLKAMYIFLTHQHAPESRVYPSQRARHKRSPVNAKTSFILTSFRTKKNVCAWILITINSHARAWWRRGARKWHDVTCRQSRTCESDDACSTEACMCNWLFSINARGPVANPRRNLRVRQRDNTIKVSSSSHKESK